MAEFIPPISNFWRCFKVMPLVYDESLSYYEVLCKLSDKLNEIIKAVNGYEEDYKKYVDDNIAVLKEYVDKQDAEYYTLVMQKIAEVEETIQNNLEYLEDLISSTDSSTRAWVLYKISDIYKYIDEKFCKDVKVYNPTTGLVESVCKVLNNIYDALRYKGINCNEFDSLKMTAEDYDKKGITAFKFDLYSKEILYKDPRFYMYNPFDGNYQNYKEIIYKLASLHYADPITSTEFDALKLTCDSFELKEITAFEFDDNAKQLLSA